MPIFTQFGTLTFSPTSTYDLQVSFDEDTPYTSQVDFRPRRGRFPLREAFRLQERVLTATILNRSGASVAQFWRDCFRTFAPGGTVALYATHDQTGGSIYTEVDIVSIGKDHSTPNSRIHVDAVAADPVWRDLTPSSVTAVAGTIVNSGDYPALPQITIGPNLTTILRRRIAVVDNSGRGQSNYFVRARVNTSAVWGTFSPTAAMFDAYYRGRRIPFGIGQGVSLAGGTIGGTATTFDFRIDLPPSGTALVDLYYSAFISNSETPNRLDYAQLDYSTNTNFAGNGTICWNYYGLSTMPNGAAFSWVPAKTGQTLSGWSYGLIAESGSNAQFAVRPDDTLLNDADSMVTVLGSGAAASNALTNLRRILTAWSRNQIWKVSVTGTSGVWTITHLANDGTQATTSELDFNASASQVQTALAALSTIGSGNVSVTASGQNWFITFQSTLAGMTQNLQINVGTVTSATGEVVQTPVGPNVRAFVRYRTAGQLNWTDAWTTTTAGTVDTAIDVPGAVMLAVGIEPYGTAMTSGGTLRVQNVANSAQVVLGSDVPAVTVGAAGTAWLLHGSHVNSTTNPQSAQPGTITFTNVLTDGTLTVDAYNAQITPGTLVWYGDIAFSNPDQWFSFACGSNAVSGTVGGTISYAFQRRWIV